MVRELGKSVGIVVRNWLGCVVEFVEGFKEGAGDLGPLNERLANLDKTPGDPDPADEKTSSSEG